MEQYSFTRYLSAKKRVDDRALNQRVWNSLEKSLSTQSPQRQLQVLEVGCGIGTMVGRMVDWRLLTHAEYTGVDFHAGNLTQAPLWMQDWAGQAGYCWSKNPKGGFHLLAENLDVSVNFIHADILEFLNNVGTHVSWDLLIAHAFLDLIDIPATLPRLLKCLHQGGLFYFSANFDGMTTLEPALDSELDARIESLYHRTIDERRIGGVRSGDSRSGRHLFAILNQVGAEILEAGASDWVVYPRSGFYPGDEAYFLHFIIHTIEGALLGQPGLDPARLKEWADERHSQVDRCELIYIAHQMDFLGRV